MSAPQRPRKSRRLSADERHRALEHAVNFARGRRQELESLRYLVPSGGRDAGLPPRWYGELAGELVGLGLLDRPDYPPAELKILAKLLGYYLWCALAAAESDRGNEPGCRRVLDGIVNFLGLNRLQNFDFNQLQPRETDTFPPFDLTILRRCLEPFMVPAAGEAPPEGDRGAPAPPTPASAEATPAGADVVAAPVPPPTQGPELAALGHVFDHLSELVGRIDADRRRLGDCLERGDLDEARGASQRLGEAVAMLAERLGACKELTRGQPERDRPS